MPPWRRGLLAALVALAASAAQAREACQQRVLSLRFAPPTGRAHNWCWAASSQMIMELLGEEPRRSCQCRQAEQVLGVTGCCATAGSCVVPEDLPLGCDRPRWPAFVERPDAYPFAYATTCDGFPGRQDDESCDTRPLEWTALTAEICSGRPVIAALRPAGSTRGHTVVVKGFSTRPERRVLVVDPARVCPADRDCEGELDEGFWISYDEYVAGWNGMVHWVDFYGIARRARGKRTAASVQPASGVGQEVSGEPLADRRSHHRRRRPGSPRRGGGRAAAP
jgi:hypothetical protein